MKRGLIALEALTKLLPHILISLALLAILYSLISSFFPNPPEEHDFERIVKDMETVIKSPGSISPPIVNPNGLLLRTFSKQTSPPSCRGNPCVCIEYRKDDKSIPVCKPFKLSDCGSCEKACLTSKTLYLPPERKSVTISRTCDEIEIK